MCVCVCVCERERVVGGVQLSWEMRACLIIWPTRTAIDLSLEVSEGEMRVLEEKKDEKTKIGVNYVLILSGTFYLQKFLFHYMSRIFCSYFSNPNKSNMCSVNALWAAYLYMQVWSLALTCKSLWWNSSILTTLKRDGLTMDWAAVWHLVWESVGTRQFHVLHHGGKLFTKTCH